MPLTPSHAAAALLLKRLPFRLPLAALVIGTLSPDFEYLFRLAPRGRFGHSLPGLVLFCLPVSLLVWGAYRAWIRPAMRDLLPPGLAAGDHPRPTSVPAVACTILLGALSHVVWDGFTHVNGFAVALLPGLREPVTPSLAPGIVAYKALQHGSTVVGGLVLLLSLAGWVRTRPPAARRFAPGQAARALRVAAGVLGAAALAAVLNGLRGLDGGMANGLGYAAVGAMVGFGIALLTYGLQARGHGRPGWGSDPLAPGP